MEFTSSFTKGHIALVLVKFKNYVHHTQWKMFNMRIVNSKYWLKLSIIQMMMVLAFYNCNYITQNIIKNIETTIIHKI